MSVRAQEQTDARGWISGSTVHLDMDAMRGSEGVGDVGADRLADDLAALHRVATLPPRRSEDRMAEWIDAGRRALGASVGLALVSTADGLVVRAVNAGGEAAWSGKAIVVGDVVRDSRVDVAIARAETVATLEAGMDGGEDDPGDLGAASLVVCPLWVSGRVSGATVYIASADSKLFSTWALACADVAADGVSRTLEHQHDTISLDSAESWADAVVRLIPDPVLRLDPQGHVRSNRIVETQVFDPCRDLREFGDRPDPVEVRAFQSLVTAALGGTTVRTAHFTAGRSPDDRRVEVRLVPTGTGDVLCIVRDVTDLHRVESALAEQVAFESLVGSVSARLVGGTTAAIDEATVSGLGEIARYFGADAAVIRELSSDGRSLHVLHHCRHHQRNRLRHGKQISLFARIDGDRAQCDECNALFVCHRTLRHRHGNGA